MLSLSSNHHQHLIIIIIIIVVVTPNTLKNLSCQLSWGAISHDHLTNLPCQEGVGFAYLSFWGSASAGVVFEWGLNWRRQNRENKENTESKSCCPIVSGVACHRWAHLNNKNLNIIHLSLAFPRGQGLYVIGSSFFFFFFSCQHTAK